MMDDAQLKEIGQQSANGHKSAVKFAFLLEEGKYLEALQYSELLGKLDIERIRKLGEHDSHYEMVLKNGKSVPLGSSLDLQNPSKITQRIADACKVTLPLMKKATWWPYFEAIIGASGEAEDTFNSPQEVMQGWLLSFLGQVDPEMKFRHHEITLAVIEEFKTSINGGLNYTAPLVQEGNMVTLRPGDIAKHVNLLLNESVSTVEIRKRLRLIDFEPVILTVRGDGSELHQVRAWKGPIPQEV